MKIINVDIGSIIPYEKNPRKNDGAVKYVANSIREFGFQQPIVIDKNYVIIAGHTRYKAALLLNMGEVPCVYADDLSPEQVKAYRLADNKTNEYAEWIPELLEDELDELKDAFTMTDYGFIMNDSEIIDERIEVTEDDISDSEEFEKKVSKGQLWKLGNHFLMCGDSTNADDIAKLMHGDKAKMIFTSPPYSDMREYKGGNMSVSYISDFITEYKPYTDYQVVNLGIKYKNSEVVQYWDEYIDKAKKSGYKLLAWNIWDKVDSMSVSAMTSTMFPTCHEWIFVFGTEKYEINRTTERKSDSSKNDARATRTHRNSDGTLAVHNVGNTSYDNKKMKSIVSIPNITVAEGSSWHPAPFPVQLSSEYIQAMTKEDDIVIEPFCGSGTTLIACEQLNRICYGMEFSEEYCDGIIARWEKLTGNTAELVAE